MRAAYDSPKDQIPERESIYLADKGSPCTNKPLHPGLILGCGHELMPVRDKSNPEQSNDLRDPRK